ncbi:MAG: FG-GAP repeat protein [Candidatus Binatia bacterium]|nr:FG-GAP repeat protein [Candidatus Binatia bacterium]
MPLTFRVELRGSVHPKTEAGGRDAALVLDEGTEGLPAAGRRRGVAVSASALGYRGLFVYDATGKELEAWMEVRGNVLLLHIQDTDAAYPIVVDPFIQQGKLTASNGQEGDEFGFAVAVSGNTVVIGAPFKDSSTGAVYIFEEPASGWATT